MTVVVDSSGEQAVETTGVMEAGWSSCITTLYDLIGALQATVEPGEDGHVVEAVTDWLRSGRIVLLGKDRGQADLSYRHSDCSHDFTMA